ncbi:DUF4440 domain-containing protein [Tunturiibacter gelidoferens]|uniref:DUF4440 domain-containing protein n=1 Tax=Tunturiibacter lichenicola TaxID=2051959 RepID=A0A7Y9NME9_9BACT|nr:hypothetical protein [Edaphobacter lichenicola]
MKRGLVAAFVIVLAVCSTARGADTPKITESKLVQRTQELFDAVAPGNQAPWKMYVAEDAMFFDEKGRSMDKAALLEDLQPLPAGYSGTIRVMRAKSRFATNVAVLSYDCDEVETVFGRELHARYYTTDTWLYRNQAWQIVASQTLRYYEDPAAGAVSDAMLNDYAGAYELAAGNVVTVTRQGSELYAQRNSGKPYQLLPESPDLFFRAGVEGRRLFHRDASGHVDMMIDRRNNEDLLWKKIR